jgi:hypothetical protein
MTATEIESTVRQLMRERDKNLKEIERINAQMNKIAAKVKALAQEKKTPKPGSSWWRELAGKFDGDPVFADVVREGRKWRNSQRPKKRIDRAHP